MTADPVAPAQAGYHIDLTLPVGVTVTAVIAQRDELSSGLHRGIGTLGLSSPDSCLRPGQSDPQHDAGHDHGC